MATLYIEEHDNIMKDRNGNLVQSTATPTAVQKLTVGASSAASSTFNSSTRFLLLVSDTACQYELAASPTADGDSRFLPANVFRPVQCVPGEKIAVIAQQ